MKKTEQTATNENEYHQLHIHIIQFREAISLKLRSRCVFFQFIIAVAAAVVFNLLIFFFLSRRREREGGRARERAC